MAYVTERRAEGGGWFCSARLGDGGSRKAGRQGGGRREGARQEGIGGMCDVRVTSS